MVAMSTSLIRRRVFLQGAAAMGVLALPGCASIGNISFVEAVRRLLTLSAQNAFARLTQPDGFWDSTVARIDLPVLFGKRGGIVQGILTSGPFREKLQHRLNNVAEAGARRAAPVVADTVRTIGVENAVAILKGGPTAATSFLRDGMGPGLVNAMIPALDDALRVADDPIINQAVAALTGVDIGMVAHALAIDADNAIWYEIGQEETAIRANPESTNDPVLIAALKAL
ncbi:MAG: DUF4197 domain-containing protein [Novosphingobium sp.]|nr:DUF4197 domain-containing protein [Novosphingobium sp.]MCP5402740.1 DUF4197 domain-containing protein [Novosphingobium sp.]